jgi:hypothetical protein
LRESKLHTAPGGDGTRISENFVWRHGFTNLCRGGGGGGGGQLNRSGWS